MKNALGRLVSGISGAFEMNEAFLSGALDVIVIEHPDGSLHCSPFHVRFGKLKLLRSREKIVRIFINGSQSDVKMRLGKAGEAYFIEDFGDEDLDSLSPQGSPVLSPGKSPSPTDMSSEDDKDPASPINPSQMNYKWYTPWRRNPDPGPKKGIFGSIFTIFNRKVPQDEKHEGLVLSLCLDQITGEDSLERVFTENVVPPEVFSTNPWAVLNNPNLLLRINGKYYNWEKAAPILVSMIAYKSLAEEVVEVKEKSLSPEPGPGPAQKRPAVLRKTLALSSDELKKLGLKHGTNTVVYEVNSRLQGIQQIHSKIYLWNSSAQIVISDVDGTVTKSDVLGQIYPMVGKDWTHAGIAKFYSDIVQHGYKIMYLTSRAIGQAKITKEYLQSVNQENFELPEGPLIMSPDRLFKSFVREVIERTPQKFKAEKLREIAALFPEDRNPFYAGFGNRDTDAIAYRAAGVPLNKIFIINTESRIFVYNNTYAKTYTQLDDIVFQMFPPRNEQEDVADYEYSELNFWKTDYLPLLNDEL